MIRLHWWLNGDAVIHASLFVEHLSALTWDWLGNLPQWATVPTSTHLFTCVCLFVCLQGAVAGAGSSKVEDTFVPLWRLFGVKFTRAFPKKVGKSLQSFETLWFQYCVIHREMCSMTLRPIQFAICLTLYTSTSYYTILSIDFAAITLTFPRPQKNRGIWIAWLTCC